MGCVETKQSSKLRVGSHFVLNNVESTEDFLSHHMTSELQLSRTASPYLIRMRQIIEHMFIRVCSREDYKHLVMLEKAWIQGLFVNFVTAAEEEFLWKSSKRSFKEIRASLTEKVLFELYQLKEFFESSAYASNEEVQLGAIMLLADSALYDVFAQIASKYKITEEARIIFPRIQTLRNHVNLLTRFPAQISKETTYDNINLLYRDLKFLLRTAVKEFPTFRHDMKELFGGDLSADIKVKEHELQGRKGFSSVGFRRILVKWAETLLEIWPEMVSSIHFLRFMEKKNRIFDDFCFGSTASFSNQISNLLVNLIYSAQFNSKTKRRNKEFGFYIYDLLRCKVHTKSSFQAFDLLRKIKAMEATVSGKKLQVVRVKNRLDSHNRDILVNFLYGDILVAQAQIAVVSGFYNEGDSRRYQLKHYIYEFERSIFGPTIELILEYEDEHSKDDFAQLFARGRVRRSGRSFPKYFIKHSQVSCPSGHFCLEMTGNMFNNNDDQFVCDCCSAQTSFDGTYFHCYKCSLLFCSSCSARHQNNFAGLAVSVINDRLKVLRSKDQAQAAINGCNGMLLLLIDQNSPASRLYHNFLAYYLMSRRSSYELKSPCYEMSHNSATRDFIASLGVESFPALLLLDRNFSKVKYMLGVEVFKLSEFLLACDLYLEDPQHRFTAHCQEGHKMRLLLPDSSQNWECSECSASTLSAPKFFNNKCQIVDCDICKYTLCSNCGFLGVDDNKCYQDRYGESYLSTIPTKRPKTIECPSNSQHIMNVLFSRPLPRPLYRCGKCRGDFYFIDEQGMPYCSICQCILCQRCEGARRPNNPGLKEIEYVNHYAEVTANDGMNCENCNKPYKKAYDTRTASQSWKCFLCEKTFSKNIQHLSCFRCVRHVCTSCIYASKILRAAFSFQFEGESQFICQQKHLVKELNGPQNRHEEQGTFQCSHCEGLFYIDTTRHVCSKCDITSCAECLLDCFEYADTTLRCQVGHNLTQVLLKTSVPKGFYCAICMDFCSDKEADGSWKCATCRNYQICKECSCRMLKLPHEEKTNREKCECGKRLKRLKRQEESLSVCHYCQGMIKEQLNWSCKYCHIVICIECLV